MFFSLLGNTIQNEDKEFEENEKKNIIKLKIIECKNRDEEEEEVNGRTNKKKFIYNWTFQIKAQWMNDQQVKREIKFKRLNVKTDQNGRGREKWKRVLVRKWMNKKNNTKWKRSLEILRDTPVITGKREWEREEGRERNKQEFGCVKLYKDC